MGSVWTHSWGSFTNYSNDRCGFANSPYDCNLYRNNRLFLYKINILNISKPSNGLRYGRLVGMAVYLVFALPVEQFDLVRADSTSNHEEHREYQNGITFSNIHLNSMLYSIFINLLSGITLGLFSSLLTMKFGARYRCPQCDISFSRIDTLQNHLELPTVEGYKGLLS